MLCHFLSATEMVRHLDNDTGEDPSVETTTTANGFSIGATDSLPQLIPPLPDSIETVDVSPGLISNRPRVDSSSSEDSMPPLFVRRPDGYSSEELDDSGTPKFEDYLGFDATGENFQNFQPPYEDKTDIQPPCLKKLLNCIPDGMLHLSITKPVTSIQPHRDPLNK